MHMHENHKRRIEDLLRQTQSLVSLAFDQADEPRPTDDLVEYHSDIDYVELASRLFNSVHSEALFVNGQLQGHHPDEIDRFRRQITAMPDRGVSVNLICHPDELTGHDRQRFLEEISARPGAEVRISTVRLHGTFIFDNRQALMWNSRRNRHCLLVRSPTIVEPLLRLTDIVWSTSCELDVFLRCRRDELDEKTPQILQLLSSGCKDEVAARELGVSVRTYRRYVAELMDKLDAGSRFQAGMRAATLGLIGPDGGAGL
jgi:hypothetical protein